MKLTAQLKLQPTPAQAAALRRTLEAANAACNRISDVAWEQRTFGKFALQTLCHEQVREQFGLSAQMTIRALAKVGDAYKRDKKAKRTFRPLASIAYDDRILSFALPKAAVSIWTLDGRQAIPFVCGERQHRMLATRQGESDLLYHRGAWYLLVTCEVAEPDPVDVDGVLGLDLGIVTLATDSDGDAHTGQQVDRKRQWYAQRRAALQAVGTTSAKRRLRKLSGRQRRFQRDVNHQISQRVVAKAERTKRAIIDNFEANGIPISEIVATGGLPERNKLLMQIYADVTGRPIRRAGTAQGGALGAAMHGAVAAGAAAGGYDTIADAAARMARLHDEAFAPDPESQAVYAQLYHEYVTLHDYFGRGANDVMKRLKQLREERHLAHV